MAQRILTTFLFAAISIVVFSQQFEPEWVGEVYMLDINAETDTVAMPLEKASVKITLAVARPGFAIGFGPMAVGISGSDKAVLQVKGKKAALQVSPSKPVRLIVKCKDNSLEPSLAFQIVRLKQKDNKRTVDFSKIDVTGEIPENSKELVPFQAKKYGSSSYIVYIPPQSGEFGVRILDLVDESANAPMFYCYGANNSDNRITSAVYEYNGVTYPVYEDKKGRFYIHKTKQRKHYLPDDDQARMTVELYGRP